MDDMSSLFEINRTLGIVLAKVENIDQNMAEISAQQNALKETVETLSMRTVFLERDMSTVKPFAEKAKQWEQRGIGAGVVLSALGMIFGGALVGFRDKIFASLGLH